MKRVLLALGAAFALSACADYGPYYGGGGLAYYDNFYGPYYDGYWGSDGLYYYRSGRGRPWMRDDGRPFRRDAFEGYHGVRPRGGFRAGRPDGSPGDGRHSDGRWSDGRRGDGRPGDGRQGERHWGDGRRGEPPGDHPR